MSKAVEIDPRHKDLSGDQLRRIIHEADRNGPLGDEDCLRRQAHDSAKAVLRARQPHVSAETLEQYFGD